YVGGKRPALRLFRGSASGRSSLPTPICSRTGAALSMSELGLVSLASPVHTAMRNCARDEGRPFGVGNQVPISSRRKPLWSKAMVVNVAETPGRDSGRHGRERRAQANRCRSVESGLGDVRTGGSGDA